MVNKKFIYKFNLGQLLGGSIYEKYLPSLIRFSPMTRTLPILKELKRAVMRLSILALRTQKSDKEIGISELSDEDFISGIQRTTRFAIGIPRNSLEHYRL